MKNKALFITNSLFLDAKINEGGVRICTEEYLKLIENQFQVFVFPINNRKSIWYRILVKFGFSKYRDFDFVKYKKDINKLIIDNLITHVFLNQCNTSVFVPQLKNTFGELISIFICSHGNESGDLLHESTKFKKTLPYYKLIFANYILGDTLRKEVFFRQNGVDGVLTVSEVEVEIENWLGAKRVMLIPRTIIPNAVPFDGNLGRVGFIGDLSHAPNFYGIKVVLEALKVRINQRKLQFYVVGSPPEIGVLLEKEYDFVKYCGYLSNEELNIEIKSWAFFINPVFYYSRGVSTKLAKTIGLGLPVISTYIGIRGYQWNDGKLHLVQTPEEMADKILELSFNINLINDSREQVNRIIKSSPTIDDIGLRLNKFLNL